MCRQVGCVSRAHEIGREKASVTRKHHHLPVTEVGNMQVVGKSRDFSLKKHALGQG